MSNNKPTLPKGTRDFTPDIMYRRTYILDTIRDVYRSCGYQPLETPAMENLSVLTGKYGDEGDQLLYRVLNSGDYLKKVSSSDLENGFNAVTPLIAEKGLRYDLTVPFARHVVMNHGQIVFPYKRYQVQPVWRADRPQKGRYREFYQCDADVVGTDSLTCEAEIVFMINQVFSKLGIKDYDIKVNHRKLLSAISNVISAENENDFFIILDKLDKIGKDKVFSDLQDKGIDQKGLEILDQILELKSSGTGLLDDLASITGDNKGIQDLREMIRLLELQGAGEHMVVDPSLARGLSYYTGTIFEVKVNNVQIGSVSGGGRYDDLTGVFGLPGISGVGISFGVDRIYDVMTELSLFPEDIDQSTQLLIAHFDEETMAYGLGLLNQFRNAGISAEIYPENTKLKKQLNYANRKSIPYVLVIGSEEISSGQLTLKNMATGDQQQGNISSLIEIIR